MAITWDEFGNEVTVDDTGQNQVSDDAGTPTNPSNPDVKAAGNTENATPSATDASTISNAGTTTAGKAGATTIKPDTSQGKSPNPRPNPLGYLSSYTYQLTLYMLTPDALNAFRENGGKNISNLTNLSAGKQAGGAYIVAQSGGINNNDKRAPGFDLDYYIDNLVITSAVSPGSAQASTISWKVSFNVIEPYGFSFLSKLKVASDKLVTQYVGNLGFGSVKNASRQFFVLGVRFQGYDKYGKTLTGKETIDGRVLDPSGSGNGLFETFYQLVIRKINFKIDGKTTVYNIEAVSLSSDASSVKNATLPTQVTIEAKTVDEALQGKTGLLTHINNYYQEMIDNNQMSGPAPVYKVQYLGDITDLKNAIFAFPEETNKYLLPMGRKSTDTLGVESIPDFNKRTISFSNSPATTIIAAIERIIARSSYLRNALKTNYTNTEEPNPQSNAEESVPIDNATYFRWYNITTNVKIIGYNADFSDFIYETTFVICPYEVPILLSVYAKALPKYFGPVKRYEYWFTGKNSEIINYEQTNNNGYFIVALNPKLSEDQQMAQLAEVAKRPGFGQPDVDKTGKLAYSNEALGSIPANLYDPQSYSKAKISILGDPDFLVKDTLNYDSAFKSFNQFYAPDGYTVNPTGGQFFVEIDFKEGVDYKYSTGLMDINDTITFWQYPESVKKVVKGVSFLVTKITSNFKGGKFTQDLDMTINILSDSSVSSTTNPANGRETNNSEQQVISGPSYGQAGGGRGVVNPGVREATGSTTLKGTNSTSENTGLKQSEPISQASPSTPSEPTQSPDESGTTQASSSSDDGGRED